MPDLPFEEAFFSVASPLEQEAAPALQPYRVGFQILDKSDDGTRGAGIFGYKVNDSWFFSPIFFLGGQIKGQELLYAHDSKIMVPKNDSWIQYLVSSRPQSLGEPTGDSSDSFGDAPDFSAITRSPITGLDARVEKSAADRSRPRTQAEKTEEERIADRAELRKVASDFAQEYLVDDPDLSKFASLAVGNLQALDYRSWKNQWPTVSSAIIPGLEHRKFANAMLRFYNADDLAPEKIVTRLRVKRAAAQTTTTVKIVSDVDDPLWEKLPDEKKTLVINGEEQVYDQRKATSVIYHEDDFVFTNPTESGWYKILGREGETFDGYVSTHPVQGAGVKTSGVYIVYSEGKAAVVPSNELFVSHPIAPKEFKNTTTVDGAVLSKPGDTRPTVYLALVGQELTGAFVPYERVMGPIDYLMVSPLDLPRSYYRYDDKYRDCSYDSVRHVCLADIDGISRFANGGLPTCCGDQTYYFSTNGEVSLGVSPTRTTPGVVDGKTYVTPKTVLIALQSADSQLHFGDSMTVSRELTKSAETVAFWRDGGLYSFASDNRYKTLDKSAALQHLVYELNLGEADARKILAQAVPNTRQHVFLKRASWPINTHYSPEYGVTVDEPIEIEEERPIATPDFSQDETVRGVVDAAKSGKKEIFDVQLLKMMTQVADVDSVIDTLLPGMMTGMDKTGQMLFLFYWKNEAFVDRLGKDELPEMEDNTRQVFKTLGDVVLFLKRKQTIQARDMSGIGGVLDV